MVHIIKKFEQGMRVYRKQQVLRKIFVERDSLNEYIDKLRHIEEHLANENVRLYIIDLVSRLRQETNCENFWVWSGYTFDKILQSREKVKMLLYFDVLVDGKFELDKKDPRLMYRGSSNQRVIDIQKSIDSDEVILWSENDDL